MQNINILIVGVGGQGTLLASKILGTVAMLSGMDVKVSEVHGMSQRGGSVVTYVRMGDSQKSPLIENGGADYLMAFELMEAYRYAEYLKDDGVLIANNQKIIPMPVIIGNAKYTEGMEEYLKNRFNKSIITDALSAAVSCGSSKAVNIVLIGMLSKLTDIPADIWHKAIEQCVAPKFLAMNLAAFDLGAEMK